MALSAPRGSSQAPAPTGGETLRGRRGGGDGAIPDRSCWPPCVILAGGAWGSVLGNVRSLGRRGVEVHVLDVDGQSEVYRRSRYCRSATSVAFADDTRQFCESILEWGKRTLRPEPRPLLLPMNDRVCTAVAEHRAAFESFYDVGMARDDLVMTLLDKPRANLLAKQEGLRVPADVQVDSVADLDRVTETLRFPLIIKPTWWRQQGGAPTFKAIRVDDLETLRSRGKACLETGSSLIVQEYVLGGDEAVTVFPFYRSRHGGRTVGCTATKLVQSPPGQGIMATGRAVWLSDASSESRAFLDRVDYCGIGSLEFKRSVRDGRLYFIEMSVRAAGFHPITIKAGVDIPWYAYQDLALGVQPPQPQPLQRRAYWFDGAACTGVVKARPGLKILLKLLSVWARPGTRYAVWSLGDPRPWLYTTWRLLKNLFRRVRGGKPKVGGNA